MTRCHGFDWTLPTGSGRPFAKIARGAPLAGATRPHSRGPGAWSGPETHVDGPIPVVAVAWPEHHP